MFYPSLDVKMDSMSQPFIPKSKTKETRKSLEVNHQPRPRPIAKDCLLTLVKSRLALGSPGCLVVCHHAENGPIHRKMVVACPLVITSKVKFFFRPNKTRKGE